MPSQLQGFLLPTNFGSDGMTSHKHGLAAKCSFKLEASRVEFLAPFGTNFFRIKGTLHADTLVSGKAECLLAIGEYKKVSFLEWGLLVGTMRYFRAKVYFKGGRAPALSYICHCNDVCNLWGGWPTKESLPQQTLQQRSFRSLKSCLHMIREIAIRLHELLCSKKIEEVISQSISEVRVY